MLGSFDDSLTSSDQRAAVRYLLIPDEAGGLSRVKCDALCRTFKRSIQTGDRLVSYALSMAGMLSKQ